MSIIREMLNEARVIYLQDGQSLWLQSSGKWRGQKSKLMKVKDSWTIVTLRTEDYEDVEDAYFALTEL